MSNEDINELRRKDDIVRELIVKRLDKNTEITENTYKKVGILFEKVDTLDKRLDKKDIDDAIYREQFKNIHEKICGNGQKGVIDKQEEHDKEIITIKTEIATARGMAKALGIISVILGILATGLSIFITIKGLI